LNEMKRVAAQIAGQESRIDVLINKQVQYSRYVWATKPCFGGPSDSRPHPGDPRTC
jgi:hypothetical protein